MHAFEMPGEQRLHPIIVKVAGFDDGHRSQDIPCAFNLGRRAVSLTFSVSERVGE